MIEVRDLDGTWWRVTYPFTVETNAKGERGKMADVYSGLYQQEIGEGKRYEFADHEHDLAAMIFDIEGLAVWDDAQAVKFKQDPEIQY